MSRLATARRFARLATCCGTLALLAACASHTPHMSATQEAARYAARAHRTYAPPGPAEDPWGPYIREASTRFDVPELWIRSVMHVESGGKEYLNGDLITSNAGAMGLMQVMPGTYDELRERYGLGEDPFDPHDNILAGVAYMREMYDIYGSPGFLAAYNAGPARLDDYLSNNRALPDETRRYVAMIGPAIEGVYPLQHSAAEQYAMNALPTNIPPGMRYGRVQLASAAGGTGRVPMRGPVQVAQLPEPPRPVSFEQRQVAWAPRPVPYEPRPAPLAPPPAPPMLALAAPPPPPPSRGFHLIAPANAEPIPFRHVPSGGSGGWAIQVGAYTNEAVARSAVGNAQAQARRELGAGRPQVASVRATHGLLWRARLVGLSQDGAVQACQKLHGRMNCIVLSPDAQL